MLVVLYVGISKVYSESVLEITSDGWWEVIQEIGDETMNKYMLDWRKMRSQGVLGEMKKNCRSASL